MSAEIITMYLPQFHQTPENDMWWGEGFTEWTSVKSAKSLYDGHKQPRKPLNEYNLLDPDVLQSQADLMQKYGVDGQCFYHYWFGNSKMMLEKPAEILLKNEQIDMRFCFSWANESWIRTWENAGSMDALVWASNKMDNSANREVLIEQVYGDEEEWVRHYMYLLPFFRDKRYVKVDERPVFVIYKPGLCKVFEKMKAVWDKLAEENDVAPVYFVATNLRYEERGAYDDVMIQEPQTALLSGTKEIYQNDMGFKFFDSYDDIWTRILDRSVRGGNLGGFVRYDDTPRHGKGGIVIYDETPEKFKDYMAQLLAKADVIGSHFVFINAWNEWGEGMYIEPDSNYKNGFLEGVNKAKKDYVSYLETYRKKIQNPSETSEPEIAALNRKIDKYRQYWQTFDKWIRLYEEKKSLSDYLSKHKFKNVAIYGGGMFCQHLLSESLGIKECVNYIIDRKDTGSIMGKPAFSPNGEIPETDLIIVTVLYDYENIEKLLKKLSTAKIIAIDKLIDLVLGE